MRIVASAPGKLVLAGEYAVLEGAPALVMAVDRRARVTLDDCNDEDFSIAAPAFGITAARCRLDDDGRVRWLNVDATAAASLRLVVTVMETLAAENPLLPFRADLDTGELFCAAATPCAPIKLGLGSSAALTVALTAAICARNNRSMSSIDTLIATHRRLQGGRGSGLDIASSQTGGLLIYRLRDDAAQMAPAAWPSGLQMCCVWSGQSASTTTALARLYAWREREPAQYDKMMRELGVCAAASVSAVEADDARGLLHTLAAYAAALQRLDNASGIPIVSAEHRAIAALAAECGVVYKTCGAGGGDLGIALHTDAARLARLRQRLSEEGWHPLDVNLDPCGLQVQSRMTRNRRPSWTLPA